MIVIRDTCLRVANMCDKTNFCLCASGLTRNSGKAIYLLESTSSHHLPRSSTYFIPTVSPQNIKRYWTMEHQIQEIRHGIILYFIY